MTEQHGGKMDKLAGLDEETKAKVQTIMEQQKSGTITREEAQTQLAGLGVEMPGTTRKNGQSRRFR